MARSRSAIRFPGPGEGRLRESRFCDPDRNTPIHPGPGRTDGRAELGSARVIERPPLPFWTVLWRDFSTIVGAYRCLVWWSAFIVSARGGPWISRNMSRAIRPRIVA